MTTLSDLSRDLAGVVEAVGRSVVRVEARRRLPSSGILWAEGLVVTASHTVQREDQITVGLPDGGKTDAALVGRDLSTDVAALRLAAPGGAAAERVGVEGLRLGHLVLALGRPGRTVRASMGIVSALGESWRTPEGSPVDHYLQTDASFPPGFSGGPLVEAAGRVLGLNTAALARGFSLTIPAATVQRVAESLLAHGRVRRAYLGIGAHPVRLADAVAQALNQRTGLLVMSVEPGSPAERAGLLVGDILVTFDGGAVETLEGLMGQLGDDRIGRAAAVRIVRAGQPRDLTVPVGER